MFGIACDDMYLILVVVVSYVIQKIQYSDVIYEDFI